MNNQVSSYDRSTRTDEEQAEFMKIRNYQNNPLEYQT